MLYYKDLDKIIFNRDQICKCDELVILSGYVGPNPIRKLETLNLKTTVIYGMYGSVGIQNSLHKSLIKINSEVANVSILYSQLPVHSKCYIWKRNGEVEYALVGSANFSNNGLMTPFREVLAETTVDTFNPLNDYLKIVLNQAISCDAAKVKNDPKKKIGEKEEVFDPDICSIPLYNIDDKTGKHYLEEKSGVNWGIAKLTGSHVNINDAYIRILKDAVKKYPSIFPPKQETPSDDEKVYRKNHRHNDAIEIIWDDGTVMTGLLEGTQSETIDGEKILYPKQIATTPHKKVLGKYLRKRLGVPEGIPITMIDLERYGRDTIDISLQGEGVYFFDFSTTKNNQLHSDVQFPNKVAEDTFNFKNKK